MGAGCVADETPSTILMSKSSSETPLCAPDAEVFTRLVVPASRSRTNTSGEPLVSPGTRLSACDQKVTKRPLPLTEGLRLTSLAGAPDDDALTSTIRPFLRA